MPDDIPVFYTDPVNRGILHTARQRAEAIVAFHEAMARVVCARKALEEAEAELKKAGDYIIGT